MVLDITLTRRMPVEEEKMYELDAADWDSVKCAHALTCCNSREGSDEMREGGQEAAVHCGRGHEGVVNVME